MFLKLIPFAFVIKSFLAGLFTWRWSDPSLREKGTFDIFKFPMFPYPTLSWLKSTNTLNIPLVVHYPLIYINELTPDTTAIDNLGVAQFVLMNTTSVFTPLHFLSNLHPPLIPISAHMVYEKRHKNNVALHKGVLNPTFR